MNWKNILTVLTQYATSFGIKLLAAIIILSVGAKCISIFVKWFRKGMKNKHVDESLQSFLGSFIKITLYTLLFVTIAMILGVPATSFITILASCGVAIGLALQGSLSNFAGGLMILFFKPFKLGDYIEASGESGTVVGISVVYTELLTPDNKRITVPNGTLTNSVVINYSAEKTRRVDLNFSVPYNCDDKVVRDLINGVIDANKKILKDPVPFINITEHGDKALIYTVRVWCNSEDYWTVYFDVFGGVKAEFDKNNIEIPFPQIDVHIKNQ